MKRTRPLRSVVFCACFLVFAAAIPHALAQEAPRDDIPEVTEEYFRAEVLSVAEPEISDEDTQMRLTQTVHVRVLDGPMKGAEIDIPQYEELTADGARRVEEGDTIVVVGSYSGDGGEADHYILDEYRLPSLLWVFVLFFMLALVFGRARGVMSIVGLLFSAAVLVFYVVPGIIGGGSPLAVSLAGAFMIAVVSLYLAHGFSRRTTVAFVSTVITLGISAGLAIIFVSLAKLTGLGSEDAFYLQIGMAEINLHGLLLGGIILGALGVLDDVTMAQAASVEEIHRADPDLPKRELYIRGMSVGREHIASMMNTLALAYFGASLPLFLLFTVNKVQPWWVIMNGELISEEIVRTLVGSSALICAVPIATLIAAHVFAGRRRGKMDEI